MDNRNKATCQCGKPAKLRISSPNFRFAEPLTMLQDLGGGRGYKKIGWKPDSGVFPRPGQPYKTAKEVEKEKHGGIKEV